MKKVFIAMLAIVIVILSFSLGSWGVENEAVLAGYENTRKYATDAKMLTVAVDTYKNAVGMHIRDEEARNDFETTLTSDLGSWGTLLTDDQYKSYTAALRFTGDSDMYFADDEPVSGGISLAANFEGEEVLNHITYNNEACSGHPAPSYEDKCVKLYSAWQCAAFGCCYVNQVAYRDYVKSVSDVIVVGGHNTGYYGTNDNLVQMGTCWKTSNGPLALTDVKTVKEFLHGITPGTFIRSDEKEGVSGDKEHSYIVLGADDTGLVILDGNSDGKCGIILHRWTWEDYAKNSFYTGFIRCIIAPANSKLPSGCYSEVHSQDGYILGKESE